MTTTPTPPTDKTADLREALARAQREREARANYEREIQELRALSEQKDREIHRLTAWVKELTAQRDAARAWAAGLGVAGLGLFLARGRR